MPPGIRSCYHFDFLPDVDLYVQRFVISFLLDPLTVQ